MFLLGTVLIFLIFPSCIAHQTFTEKDRLATADFQRTAGCFFNALLLLDGAHTVDAVLFGFNVSDALPLLHAAHAVRFALRGSEIILPDGKCATARLPLQKGDIGIGDE